MITLATIVGSAKKLFGINKKDGFLEPWKSGLQNYGKTTKAKMKLPFKVEKIIATVAFVSEAKSYISRSEKRKEYGLKLARVSCVIVAIILTAMVLKKTAMDYATSLEFFKIKEIWVYGSTVCTIAEIKDLAEFDYNSSLLALRPEKVEENLVSHPWIKSAKVDRIWPDGISVEIIEQTPAALLVQEEGDRGKMYYVNNRGKIIAAVKAGEEVDFPVITGLHTILDDQRELALQEAAEFLKLIGRNNPNLPAQSVSELHFNLAEGMIVRLVDFPFPIYFGRGEVRRKYKQLRKVLAILYKKQKQHIDINKVEYIRMDYSYNKVLVAQSDSG